MNNLFQPVQMGVGVMPETLFIIAGQVAKDFSTEEMVAQDTYNAMLFVKQNFMGMTQELGELFTQCRHHLDLETAHEITYNYLCEKLIGAIPNRNKKTTWEDLKEAAKTDSERAIMHAIELATGEELDRIAVAYPDLVEMYSEYLED